MSQTIGLVLAGGRGSRMGQPKGEILFRGRSLAERAAFALRPLCGSVLISIAPGATNPSPSFSAVEDSLPAGRGPLAGIEAGFAATGRADLLVLACDYPAVETDLLRAILAAARPEQQVVFPVDPKGKDHPLVALWRRSAESAVRDALARRQHKVRAILGDLAVQRVRQRELPGLDLGRALVNVNVPEDLLGG